MGDWTALLAPGGAIAAILVAWGDLRGQQRAIKEDIHDIKQELKNKVARTECDIMHQAMSNTLSRIDKRINHVEGV